MDDNARWLLQLRMRVVSHMDQHIAGCRERVRELPAGSDEACEIAADLAVTEQSLLVLERQISGER